MVSGRNILLVEDDVALHKSLKSFLTLEGYEVISAFNGVEALELLKSGNRPSIILLDLMMPLMNGYEFLNQLSERGEINSIPIVITSAAVDAVSTAEKFGLKSIEKPIDLDSLIEILK